MAWKAKIDNAIKKRFDRQETKRRENVRPKRRFFLIVCDGVQTEPNYFRGLKSQLPPNVVELVELAVFGTGANTLGTIEEAQKRKIQIEQQQPGRVIDEVWAVFDRDSFPDQNFNNAIAKGQETGVQCAWSNEAFELWYLLHFQNFENAMPRQKHKKLLERELSQRMGKPFIYAKNSESMFILLQQHGKVDEAIKRAKRLEHQFAGRTDYANHNPCTLVYALVERLLPPETVNNHN